MILCSIRKVICRKKSFVNPKYDYEPTMLSSQEHSARTTGVRGSTASTGIVTCEGRNFHVGVDVVCGNKGRDKVRVPLLVPFYQEIDSYYRTWKALCTLKQHSLLKEVCALAVSKFNFFVWDVCEGRWIDQKPLKVKEMIRNRYHRLNKIPVHEKDSVKKCQREFLLSGADDIFGGMVKRLNEPFLKDRIIKQCQDMNDLSIHSINGGTIELHLDESSEKKGKGTAYRQMVALYPNDIPTPSTVKTFLENSIKAHDSNLAQEYKIENLALLLRYGKQYPQPVHMDTPQNSNEMFGILMLTQNSNGTIVYNMREVPQIIKPLHLQYQWPDASPATFQKVNDNLMKAYGGLIYADPSRRGVIRKCPQYTLLLVDGGHPHCAPPSNNYRLVLFFTMCPKTNMIDPAPNNVLYDGTKQMSREKFMFIMYEDMLERKNKGDTTITSDMLKFMLKTSAQYIGEGGSFGSHDDTLDFTDDAVIRWNGFRDTIVEKFKKLEKYKKEAAAAISVFVTEILLEDNVLPNSEVEQTT